ncbi:hypothetical protein [Oceaniovalibus sp. ACAM 378]|uniref:hypothetical protein n=1 Tax=Oceaniovalibus sp. ACAM 378 TaxID=2599923 RepID=UPI0011D69733|nr:hypothetical protein [Oceaniovalibus sp. ACAM 378]TYB89928.1 hypothetical protein FQ320_07395 [Oceaniovalibus sp. ACAM 378]
MATKEIPIEADLQELLKIPSCDLLRLNRPKPLSVQMPGGPKVQAFADISKGIPTDCSFALSISLQIAPFLMSTHCLVQILAMLEAVKSVVEDLPIPSFETLEKFFKAADGIADCVLAFTPLGLFDFIRDLLLLIIKFLKCFIGAMKSMIETLGGLTIKIGEAEALGNDELKQLYECARENAANSNQTLQDGLGPVVNLIDLVKPLLEIAGIPVEVELPAAADPEDLEAMTEAIQKIEDIVVLLEQVVETIP